MLHCGDGVLGEMRGVGFAPDIAFSLMVKKLNFSLIWTEYFLPYVWGVSHRPFGEHQTCFLNFSLSNGSFWPVFRKAQLCGVYGLKWSYGQILQSPLWSFACFSDSSALSLVSLLPLRLMPSLPSLWVLVGVPPPVRFVVVPYFFNFLIMNLMVLHGMFKVYDFFF